MSELQDAPPVTEPLYDCPYCEGQLAPLADHSDLVCTCCGRRFESEMIYAYKDAEEAFVQGHRNIATMIKRRIEPRRDLLEAEAKELFRFAYNKLHTAIRYRLPEIYRLASIEMLAEITFFFSERGMTSRYEAGYWRRLLSEVDDDRALTELDGLLSKPLRGPLDPFKRLYARTQRRRRLNRLRLIDRQIVEIEQIIGFVDPVHIRQRSHHLDR